MYRGKAFREPVMRTNNSTEKHEVKKYVVYKDYLDNEEASKRGLVPGQFVLIYPVNTAEYKGGEFFLEIFSEVERVVMEERRIGDNQGELVCLDSEFNVFQKGSTKYSLEEFRDFTNPDLADSGMMIIRVEDEG
jgi:hypothetical protein